MITTAKLEELASFLSLSVSPAPTRARLALEALAMAAAAHGAALYVESAIAGVGDLAMGLLATSTSAAAVEAEILAVAELLDAGIGALCASEIIEKVKELSLQGDRA